MKTSTFNRIFENARSVNIQSNEWFNTKAGYFLRERGIGFCWSCEHLRGRSYVENSIKSVEVKEA